MVSQTNFINVEAISGFGVVKSSFLNVFYTSIHSHAEFIYIWSSQSTYSFEIFEQYRFAMVHL